MAPQQTIPSVTQHVWEGAEPRLRAVMEGLQQLANEGHRLPRSMGLLAPGGLPVPERVGSKALPILNKSLLTHRCQEEALSEEQEPPRIHAGEVSDHAQATLVEEGVKGLDDKSHARNAPSVATFEIVNEIANSRKPRF